MDTRAFDGLARQIGRRRTLQSLGGAALAIASGVALADAKGGKNNQQKNRKKKQKLQQRIDQESLALCASQVPECVTALTANCEDNAECVARGQTCCQELSDCDFAGLLTCLEQSVND